MKKLFLIPALVFAVAVTSCNKSSNNETATVETVAAISVDSVFANPDAIVGDTIVIEGVCSHLCKHGGRKAFVLGSDDNVMIRCEATAEMGGAFPQESIHKPLRVKGVLRESRIDEESVKSMEAAHASQVEQMADQLSEDELAAVANNPGGCDTERKAEGQADIATFEARMADYRAKIAARAEAEGKPYLSQYFIEALSYEILPE